MTVENLETYTSEATSCWETASITPTRVTLTNATTNSYYHLYRDFGVAYFGDFIHTFTMNRGLPVGATNPLIGGYAVSNWTNAVANLATMFTVGIANKIHCIIVYVTGTTLTLLELNGDISVFGFPRMKYDTTTISYPFTKYMVLRRTDATITLEIYDDAERKTLYDTLTIDGCSKEHLQYVYAHLGDGTPTLAPYPLQSGYQENIEIVEHISPKFTMKGSILLTAGRTR